MWKVVIALAERIPKKIYREFTKRRERREEEQKNSLWLKARYVNRRE
jgi:hypothetical protein